MVACCEDESNKRTQLRPGAEELAVTSLTSCSACFPSSALWSPERIPTPVPGETLRRLQAQSQVEGPRLPQTPPFTSSLTLDETFSSEPHFPSL